MALFDFFRSRSEDKPPLLERCLSVDLEVDPKTATIFDLAAVRHDGRAVVRAKGGLTRSLELVEAALDEVSFILGHNILRHDIEHLLAARPRLREKMQAPIDTLWLNPLAFPRNPYHHLVKHYHDGRLQAGHLNDPELDARLVFQVLQNQIQELKGQSGDLLLAWHYLTTRSDRSGGFDAVFQEIRGALVPERATALKAFRRLLDGQACSVQVPPVLDALSDPGRAWPMAYALAWISVSGGESVMPPWVRASFPAAALIVRALRDTNCGRPSCPWCATMNNPKGALQKWFGFPAFRPEPKDASGRPLQEVIVERTMGRDHVLGILPTGTGKSVCYQVPALSLYGKTGALTVVISPLVALMADQVQGMERAGISSAVTINGMLSMPERQEALDRVRLGQAAILLIAPEQLRSVSVRGVLKQREVGLWVLDEAHCVSKWGHDFRPDYRYISRFIREFSGDMPRAPVLCLTATAKPEVVADITAHFRDRLGVELALFDGGATRPNLRFSVQSTGRESKLGDILSALETHLPDVRLASGRSGAVVYCATRRETERVAEFLKTQELAAAHYHAGLTPDEKRSVQEDFRVGTLRVIAATNAFGMGIDKPDVRLVLHADIPGSLENYLQEAGRAGRDRQPADCVLLYHGDDVERQFTLSARSRLERHEIGAILKALRRIDEQGRNAGTVVATPGEIVREERELEFQRDSATDDTRVKTAVAWLEEAALVSREENRVQVFPSSLMVRTLDEAARKLASPGITKTRQEQLLGIVRHIMNTPPDEGISTDELTGVSGLTHRGLTKAMADLETLGLARNDIAITVQIHVGVENASRARFAAAMSLEKTLIGTLREMAPDEGGPLDLTLASHRMREAGHTGAGPHILERLLRSIERDGRDEEGGQGNIRLKKLSARTLEVALQRSWRVVDQTAAVRWTAAERLLEFLIDKVPSGTRGKDIQVETTIGELLATLNADAILRGSVRDMTKLMERALLWLHEQLALTLGKGLTVFRSAMTIQIKPSRAGFAAKDYMPLEEHYREQTLQTHVMAAYAEKGLEQIADAQRMAGDYFTLAQDQFLRRWMRGRPPGAPSARSWTTWATRPSKRSWPMTANRPMSWSWRARGPARRGCWSTASPISCGCVARIPRASLS